THHSGRRDHADIAALVVGPRRFARLQVDGFERLQQGRDWLHEAVDDHRLAVTYATGHAAGAIGFVMKPAAVVGGAVMDLGTRAPRPLHPVAQTDRLTGGNAYDRLRQQSVQPRIPLPVTAEAGRDAVRNHGEDAPERIAPPPR